MSAQEVESKALWWILEVVLCLHGLEQKLQCPVFTASAFEGSDKEASSGMAFPVQ